MHRKYPIKLILLFAILSGCASQAPVEKLTPENAWRNHHHKVSTLTNWELTGRISIKLEKEAWSASLQWQQKEEEYFLRLTAPLGRGTYEISGNPENMQLRMQKNETLQSDNPESLMQKNFGWYVPITGLSYWIKGIPATGKSADTLLFDDQGHLTDLSQSGWHVNYSRYKNIGEYQLPGRIVLENEKLKLRLVIRNWKT